MTKLDEGGPPVGQPYALTLVLRTEGIPSWEIITFPNNTRMAVSIKEAEVIAKVFGDIIGHEEGTPSPLEIVRNGSTAMVEMLKRALATAEHEATKVPGLRRTLGEIEEQ